MELKNHRIEGIDFLPAHFTGAGMKPSIVVLHDTAGRATKGNSAAYLASKNTGKVSAHFVIEMDGTVVQLVPTNLRANHAGQSSFNGRESCNAFSIGIEIVNPGRMTRHSDAFALTWWGEQLPIASSGIREIATPEHGPGLWAPYEAKQIDALVELLTALFGSIKTLTDITTHWYISPRRKADVNPLFPLEEVRHRVLGHDDPAEIEAMAGSVSAASEEMVQIDAVGDTLNLRRWPSFNPNVIAAIPDAAVVPVLRRGVFGDREWLRVLYGGQEGWIVARYTAPIVFQT